MAGKRQRFIDRLASEQGLTRRDWLKRLAERHTTIDALARELGCHATAVYEYYDREDLTIFKTVAVLDRREQAVAEALAAARAAA